MTSCQVDGLERDETPVHIIVDCLGAHTAFLRVAVRMVDDQRIHSLINGNQVIPEVTAAALLLDHCNHLIYEFTGLVDLETVWSFPDFPKPVNDALD